MRTWKKSYKKMIAMMLSFCVFVTSFPGVAFGEEEIKGEEERILIHLQSEDMKQAAGEAVMEGEPVTAEEMGFVQTDASAELRAYQEFWKETKDGWLYEFDSQVEDGSGYAVRTFIRAKGVGKTYEISGREQIVFLMENRSGHELQFQILLDGKRFPEIRLEDAQTLIKADVQLPEEGQTAPEESAKPEEGTSAPLESESQEEETTKESVTEQETTGESTDPEETTMTGSAPEETSQEEKPSQEEPTSQEEKPSQETETETESVGQALPEESPESSQEASKEAPAETPEAPTPESEKENATNEPDLGETEVSNQPIEEPKVPLSGHPPVEAPVVEAGSQSSEKEPAERNQTEKVAGSLNQAVSLSEQQSVRMFITTFDKIDLAVSADTYVFTLAHSLMVDDVMYSFEEAIRLTEEDFDSDGSLDLSVYGLETLGAILEEDELNTIHKVDFETGKPVGVHKLRYHLQEGYTLNLPDSSPKTRSAGVVSIDWKSLLFNGQSVAVSLTGGRGNLKAIRGNAEVTVETGATGTLAGEGSIRLELNPNEGYGIVSFKINGTEAIQAVSTHDVIDLEAVLKRAETDRKVEGLGSQTVISSLEAEYVKIATTSLEWGRSNPLRDATPDFTWTHIDQMDPSDLTEKEQVWDGRYATNLDAYNNKSISFDYATWLAPQWELENSSITPPNYPTDDNYEIRRFQTTFTLDEDQSVYDNIRLYSIHNEGEKVVAIDDDVYIFVYQEGDEPTEENYLDYLAFWGGTRTNRFYGGSQDYSNYHGRRGTMVNPDSPLGFSMKAGLDNIGKKLYDLYKNQEDGGAGKTYVIDMILGEFTSGGGMNALALDVQNSTGTVVTIRYYKDQVSEGNFLGSEIKKNVKIGKSLTLTTEDLNARKGQIGGLVEYATGMQVGGAYVVKGENDVIDVVYYPKDKMAKAKILYFAKNVGEPQSDASFLGPKGFCPEFQVMAKTTYASNVNDQQLLFGKSLFNISSNPNLKLKPGHSDNPNHYDGGMILNPDVKIGEEPYAPGESAYIIKVVYTNPQGPRYTLTYDANAAGQTVAVPDSIADLSAGNKQPLSEQIPKRDGYQIIGWSESQAAGAGERVYDPGDVFQMPNRNVTLYAQWKQEVRYEVIYQLNGQTYGEKEFYKAKAKVELQSDPTLGEDYEFSGWNSEDVSLPIGARGKNTTFVMPNKNVLIVGTTKKNEPETTAPTQPTTAAPTQPTTAAPTQPTTAAPTQPTAGGGDNDNPTQATTAPAAPTAPTESVAPTVPGESVAPTNPAPVLPSAPIDPEDPNTWPEVGDPGTVPEAPAEKQPDGSTTIIVPSVPPKTDVVVKDDDNDIVYRGQTSDNGDINATLEDGDYVLIAIDENNVPLAQMVFTIGDGPVPLSGLPKTGDPWQDSPFLYGLFTGVLFTGYVIRKKRKEEKEAKEAKE